MAGQVFILPPTLCILHFTLRHCAYLVKSFHGLCVLEFCREQNYGHIRAILPSMPVRVSDKICCLCILFCTRNRKCNWYAGTSTVNSELDSASNDIYFLNMQHFHPLPCHLLCAYFILLYATVHTLLRASMVYVFLSSVENKIMVILEYNNEVKGNQCF
jgi:hypothetical protein